MKLFKHLALAALMATIFAAPATAKIISFGPKIGYTASKLHFDKISSPEHTDGFTAGVVADVTVPVVGLGFDVSAMYVDRGDLSYEGLGKQSQQYFAIPINLKYKFSLPIAGSIIAPYIFTGPEFSFFCSKEKLKDVVEHKACDVAWNFGFGLQLISHLQISASYGVGLNNAVEGKVMSEDRPQIYDAKNRFWTVTAAWLF